MKILFIPHLPHRHYINRVYEFALATDSLFLDWYIENSSLYEKIKSQLLSFFRKIEIKEDRFVTMPLLFRPEGLAVRFNTVLLNYVLKKYEIDAVVLSQAWMFDVKRIRVPVIYDLVDDWLEVNDAIGVTPKRLKKIQRDLSCSRGVVTVTSLLEEKVKRFNPNTITVENGVYPERFAKARSLKRELGLEKKKVFGYIGGVDEWTGIAKACEAYRNIKDETNAMIVVGENKSAFFQNLKEAYGKDILFVGQVSPREVPDYFATLDIGLIPFDLNAFTHNAYPIKAIEYGLAGAQVISTPLRYLRRKNFPFIRFSPIEAFDVAMKETEKRAFEFDFSALSWKSQSNKLVRFVESTLKKR